LFNEPANNWREYLIPLVVVAFQWVKKRGS